MSRFACLVIGFIVGCLGALVSLPTPTQDHCFVNKVREKAVTAYVLKPPVLEQAKCEAFCPTPFVKQPDPQVNETPVSLTQDDAQVNETAKSEHEPRRRRYRYVRRHREYWR